MEKSGSVRTREGIMRPERRVSQGRKNLKLSASERQRKEKTTKPEVGK